MWWQYVTLAFSNNPTGRLVFQIITICSSLCAGLVCFIPLFLKQINSDISYAPRFLIDSGVINRLRIRDIALISFSITIPSTINAFADILQRFHEHYRSQWAHRHRKNKHDKHGVEASPAAAAASTSQIDHEARTGINSLERLLYFIGIQCCSCFVFIIDNEEWRFNGSDWSGKDDYKLTAAVASSIAASYVITTSSLAVCFHREYVTHYPRHSRSSAGFTTVSVSSLVISAVCFAMTSRSQSPSHATTLSTVSGIFAIFALLAFMGNGIRWVRKSFTMIEKLGRNAKKTLEHFFTPLVLMVAFVLNSSQIIGINLNIATHPFNIDGLTTANDAVSELDGKLFDHMILLMISAVSIIVLNQRLKNVEIARNLEALESKKSFVRYISHEVRTPLNTVSLGLDLLIEELSNDSSPLSKDYLVSATEVKQAAGIAVEILNDLLQYDKLSNDTLQVQRESQHALDLIDETINTFKIQARKADVNFVAEYGNPNLQNRELSLLGETNQMVEDNLLLQQATIEVDRPKIAQVLRNLISNALKFTPEAGTVTVRVRLAHRLEPLKKGHEMLASNSNSSGDALAAVAAASSMDDHPNNLSSSPSSLFLRVYRRLRRLAFRAAKVIVFCLEGGGGGGERGGGGGGDVHYAGGDSSVATNQADQMFPPPPNLNPYPYPNDNSNNNGEGLFRPPQHSPRITLHRVMSQTMQSMLSSSFKNFASSSRRNNQVAGTTGAVSNDNYNNGLNNGPNSGLNNGPNNGLTGIGIGTGSSAGNNRRNSNTNVGAFASPSSMMHSIRRAGGGGSGSMPMDRALPKYLIIEVTDTGVGIEKANLKRVFNEVVQFNPNELQGGGGSGLGLVISRGIVMAHKGAKIWLESDGIGKGCTFAFGLPVSFRKPESGQDPGLVHSLSAASIISRVVSPAKRTKRPSSNAANMGVTLTGGAGGVGGVGGGGGGLTNSTSQTQISSLLTGNGRLGGSIMFPRRASQSSPSMPRRPSQSSPIGPVPHSHTHTPHHHQIPPLSLNNLSPASNEAVTPPPAAGGGSGNSHRSGGSGGSHRSVGTNRVVPSRIPSGSDLDPVNTASRPPSHATSRRPSSSVRDLLLSDADSLYMSARGGRSTDDLYGNGSVMAGGGAAAAAHALDANSSHGSGGGNGGNGGNNRRSAGAAGGGSSGERRSSNSLSFSARHRSASNASNYGDSFNMTRSSMTMSTKVFPAFYQNNSSFSVGVPFPFDGNRGSGSNKIHHDNGVPGEGCGDDGLSLAAAYPASGYSFFNDPYDRGDNGSQQSARSSIDIAAATPIHFIPTPVPGSVSSPPAMLDPSAATSLSKSLSFTSSMSTVHSVSRIVIPVAKYHVLVVDDSALNRRMLVKALAAIGCTTDEAEDGIIAVDKVTYTLFGMPPSSSSTDSLRKAGGGSGKNKGGGITESRNRRASLMEEKEYADEANSLQSGKQSRTGSIIIANKIELGSSSFAQLPPPSSSDSSRSRRSSSKDQKDHHAAKEQAMIASAINKAAAASTRSSAANLLSPLIENEETTGTGTGTGTKDAENIFIVPDSTTDVVDHRPRGYDFILCDNVMPRMDGPTAVTKIRALGYQEPIFGVTGNVLQSDIELFIRHGANTVLPKPLKLSALKQAIQTFVEGT